MLPQGWQMLELVAHDPVGIRRGKQLTVAEPGRRPHRVRPHLCTRMRQRVATPLLRIGPPHWSADPHFDLMYHLRRVRVCEPTEDAV